MTSSTLKAPAASAATTSFSLLSLIAAFFSINLRDGKNSDAAYYACGL
jgi:hypothetical protein